MDEVSVAELYAGAVLRAVTCKHRGGAKGRGKRCREYVIIAADEAEMCDGIAVIHPTSAFTGHEARLKSDGALMCPWFVRDNGEVGFLMPENGAIIRIQKKGCTFGESDANSSR